MDSAVLPVTLLAVSSILVTLLSRRIYGIWLNPISFFAMLSLFHNWIGSFLDLFMDLDWVPWSTPSARYSVLWVNLGGIWAFVLGAVLTRRVGKKARKSRKVLTTRIPPAALFEAGFFILIGIMLVANLALAGAGFAQRYGMGQAATAPTASNIFMLLTLRHPFLIIGYTIRSFYGQKRPALYLTAVAIEVLLAILTGGRKMVMIPLVGLVVAYVATHRVRLVGVLRTAAAVFLVAAVSVGVGMWRNSAGKPLDHRIVHMAAEAANLQVGDYAVDALMSADSEGVQSWLYRLWFQAGGLGPPKMYGKTYVQATINAVVPRQFQGGLVYWQAAYVFKDKAYRGTTEMGYDFAFTAEAMLNWGPYLAFMSFVVLGAFVGWFFSRWRNTGSVPYAGAYFTLLGTLAVVMRADAVSLLRLVSFTLIPLAVVVYFMGRSVPVTHIPLYRRQADLWAHLFRRATQPAVVSDESSAKAVRT